MRRIEFTIQTQNFGSGIAGKSTHRFWRMLTLLCLLLMTSRGFEANAQCALVCNDDVNVSLPGTNVACTVEVAIDMVLEDPASCNAPLQVDLMTIQGQPLPGSPFLDASHIGQVFIYSVTELLSGNSCWGTITVEDKLGPNINNCGNLTLPCVIDYRPDMEGGDAPTPDFSDCSGVMSMEYTDNVLPNNCGGQGFVAVVQRSWTAVDFLGNVSNCSQVLTIERVSLATDTLECPPNLVLQCGATVPDTDPSATGYPMVEINGVDYPVVPGANGFCELAASYTDEVFDICGGGFKILRTWNVYDWCLNTDPAIPNPFTCIQVIKVEDKVAPSISCPGPVYYDAAAGGCSASLTLPPALVSDVCSGYGVKVLTPYGVVNGNGGLLLNVPVGTHTLTYVATDDCGNVSSCSVPLIIQDNTPPVAVCDEHTTVSLTADGTAIISAEVFDDGSEDNCEIDFFEVRRMTDVSFSDHISFYCSDIGTPVMVVMRVWDVAGNYNECMVDVEVQDKIGPQITCPLNKTIQCFDPVPAVEDPVINDNCGSATWTYTEVDNLSGCGVGTISRIYIATDVGGFTSSCTQTIFVENNSMFNIFDITWPADYFTTGCGLNVDPDDLPPGFDRPTVNEGPCDLVAVTHTDQELPTNPPACFKILRKWIVIDWCQYDPNIPNSPGYWEYTQIVKVEDHTPPETTCPTDTVVASQDPNCLAGFVSLQPVTATDCSNSFFYSTTIDLFSNGSTDLVLNGPDASGSYPFGVHTFHYRVEDLCGNTSSCIVTVEVRDNKKPTPVCANGLAVELMDDPVNGGGMIQLTPEMFDLGSYDNCTASGDLQLELTPSLFNCDDVGTNVVYLYVTDAAGNVDFCETYVVIQDNMVICPSPLTADVSGNIATPAGGGLNNVTVDVSGNGPLTPSITTAQNGHFQFIDLSLGHDYTFTPNHNTGFLNGVTTYDLVLITQHILQVNPFDSPYQFIAADVNKSGKVTTSDVVQLRKLILQIITAFPDNTSWRFVDAGYQFQNQQDPLNEPFPEFYNINNLSADQTGVDFVAVKIGDVNGSASTNADGSEMEDRNFTGQLVFVVDDVSVRAGETFSVAFKANNFINLYGYQFAMQFDPNTLRLAGIQTGDLTNLFETNFGLTMLDKGIITTSWDNSKNILHDNNTVLFTLTFEANTNTTLSEALHITKSIIPTEAYSDNGQGSVETWDVGLHFNNPSAPTDDNRFELFQNSPNPFKESTIIGFHLPEAGQATLTVYDLSGKILLTVTDVFSKGYNEITIGNNQLGSAGVLFYQLETQGHTATRRMIRI
ncbi:MAG TPA: T9SS type A sorting domain-containing protein [Bacteroidetes bacterium]|nr:T9SS type A sorting domain-containing protein [Bacteroidota bacterium]